MRCLLFLFFLISSTNCNFLRDDKNLNEPVLSFEKSLNENHFGFKLIYFKNYMNHITIQNYEDLKRFNDFYNFKKEKNFFIIHGWQADYEKDHWIEDLKNKIFFSNKKINIFIVSWSEYSKKYNYKSSVQDTKIVAKGVAEFIEYLYLKYEINLSKVYLIGHSLGAQIAGKTGKNLREKNYQLGKITGLDPAGPLFQEEDNNQRLSKEDASHVEVLHTNMGVSKVLGLGTILRSGHIDIFLNGGARQKGCKSFFNYLDYDDYYNKKEESSSFTTYSTWALTNRITIDNKLFLEQIANFFICDHARAYELFIDLVLEENCEYVAYKCDSYSNFLEGKCADCGENNEKCALFSYGNLQSFNNSNEVDTDYFLETNDQSPFCSYHYHLKLKNDEDFKKNYFGFEMIIEGNNQVENFKLTRFDYENSILTTLFTTSKKLDKITKIKIKNLNSFEIKEKSSIEKNCPYELAETIYMSSIDKNVRNKLSSKLCPILCSSDEIIFEEC